MVTQFCQISKHIRRDCERAHKVAKNGINPVNWATYRQIRNNYIQECRNAEKQYEQARLEIFSKSSFNSKECWKIYKSVLDMGNKSVIPTLINNDTPIVDDRCF